MLRCFDVATARSHYIKKKRFEVREKTIRRFNNFSLWELEFSIDSNKFESFIVVYSAVENFIDFSIDHS